MDHVTTSRADESWRRPGGYTPRAALVNAKFSLDRHRDMPPCRCAGGERTHAPRALVAEYKIVKISPHVVSLSDVCPQCQRMSQNGGSNFRTDIASACQLQLPPRLCRVRRRHHRPRTHCPAVVAPHCRNGLAQSRSLRRQKPCFCPVSSRRVSSRMPSDSHHHSHSNASARKNRSACSCLAYGAL